MISRFRQRRVASMLLLALAGCERSFAHPFGGYAYEPDGGPDGGCLAAPGVIDVIDGPPSATLCNDLRCWQAPDGSIYVTTQACDAPPDYRDRTGDEAGPCADALAAFRADGGRIACPAPADAGS